MQHQTDAAAVLSSFTYGLNNTTPMDAVQSPTWQSQNSSGAMSAIQMVGFSYDSTDQLPGELSNETNRRVFGRNQATA